MSDCIVMEDDANNHEKRDRRGAQMAGSLSPLYAENIIWPIGSSKSTIAIHPKKTTCKGAFALNTIVGSIVGCFRIEMPTN